MENPQQPSPFPQSQPITPPPVKTPRRSFFTADGPGVFYYIAAISLVNSILIIIKIGFYGSLAITTLISSLGLYIAESANGGTATSFIINAIAFAINAVIAGIVAGFGYLSSKGHGWAYVVGMLAYTVDALIMMWIGDWIEVLIHLYFLYRLWKGWSDLRKLSATVAKAETMSPSMME